MYIYIYIYRAYISTHPQHTLNTPSTHPQHTHPPSLQCIIGISVLWVGGCVCGCVESVLRCGRVVCMGVGLWVRVHVRVCVSLCVLGYACVGERDNLVRERERDSQCVCVCA